jgi:hypothetical protein
VGCFAVINTPSLVSNIITGVSGGMTSSPVSGTMAAGAIGALTYKGIGALRDVMPSPSSAVPLANQAPPISASSVSSPGSPKVFGAPKPPRIAQALRYNTKGFGTIKLSIASKSKQIKCI